MAIFDSVVSRGKVQASSDIESGGKITADSDITSDGKITAVGNMETEGDLKAGGSLHVGVGEIIDEYGVSATKFIRGTPNIGTKARAYLEISGGVSDGDQVILDGTAYEFDTDDSVEEGSVKLDISKGTKTQASAALTVESFPVDEDTLTVGDDVYEIDALGSGVEAGNIRVDISAKYAKATATLEFTNVVSDGEIVEINGVNFEIDTDGEITEGNVKVWVGANTSAGAAIIALAAAINLNADCGVNVADGAGDTLVATAKEFGEYANEFTVSTTCANASWGAEVTVLSGGREPTPAEVVDAIVSASAGGTMAIDFVAGEGEQLGTLLVTATAEGALDGSAGNAIEVDSTSAFMTWSSDTLVGGSDATSSEAVAIVEALEIDGFEIEAGTGEFEGFIVVKSDTEGEAGNLIEVDSVGLNIAWASETLEGGVDSEEYTEDFDGTKMFDDNNFYIASWDEGTESIVWKYIALSTLTSD